MNTLSYSQPTAVATQTFDYLNTAMGDTNQYILDDNTVVQRTVGKVASLIIQSPIGIIDLSQDPTGDLVDGIINPLLYTAHDDERDFVLGSPQQFPRNEGDLQFIDSIIKALQNRTLNNSSLRYS